MPEFAFDVPAGTVVRVTADTVEDGHAALKDMQAVEINVRHRNGAVITELSIHDGDATLFQVDGEDVPAEGGTAPQPATGAAGGATVVGDTLVLPPGVQDALDKVAAAYAVAAPEGLTRAQVLATYDHDLPEDMGDGPFEIYEDIDNGITDEPCTVARGRDVVFCLTCEAHGHLDGYEPTHGDVERWHRDL
jgi:hypothetical protein